MVNFTGLRGAAMSASALLLLGMSAASHATVISGNSSGYAIGANLTLSTLAGDVPVLLGPLPAGVSGTAPAPYAVSDSVVGANASAQIDPLTTASAGADLLSASAESDVDGLPGTRFASASAAIEGANAEISSLLLGSLLSFSADSLTSMANVSGDFGALTAMGSAVFLNASLNLAGMAPVIIPVAPAPNTTVFAFSDPLLGAASLILNEQILTGDAINSLDLVVNALHLSFDNFGLAGIGALSGDIILSQAQAGLTAQLTPVSEPGAQIMMLMLLAALAGVFMTAKGRNSLS